MKSRSNERSFRQAKLWAATGWLVCGLASPAATAADMSGAKIFQNYCSVCHGDRGDGQSRAKNALNPSPRDFGTAQAAAELTRERMIYSVTNGRPGTAMQPWKFRLSDKEIEAVVDHIRSNFMPGAKTPAAPQVDTPAAPAPQQSAAKPQAAPAKPSAPSGPADMSAPFPKGLSGDMAKGQQLFMSTCVSCHGPKGNGEGPRASFIFPRPRNFTQEDTRTAFNRPLLFNAISHGKVGTVMPAWSKVLSDQEIANVAEFVFQQFIRPESKPAGKRSK